MTPATLARLLASQGTSDALSDDGKAIQCLVSLKILAKDIPVARLKDIRRMARDIMEGRRE